MVKNDYLLLEKFVNIKAHPFHLVDNSPWPFLMGFGLLCLTFSSVLYMHTYSYSGYFLVSAFLYILYIGSGWGRDIVREATFQGHHTKTVKNGIKLGMVLFIVSEILFFITFFWGFFSNALSPTISIGAIWPPIGLQLFNPLEVPLLNTVILLFSGITVTWSHYAIYIPKRQYLKQCILSLQLTISLGILFTLFQMIEYFDSFFNINSGIYGSVFFLLTGFHGFHVIIGTIFLMITLIRVMKNHFTYTDHIGFQSAIWYWHFVDVVWLFVYFLIYSHGFLYMLF